MTFKIIKNDITKMKVDGIVNAANETLLGGNGVDGAIHEGAGPGLLEECRKLSGCKVGQAKITKGYNLDAKYVIHTVGPKYIDGNHGEEDLLRSAYLNSLELGKENNLKSIAFPLISSGVYGYPKKEALEVAIGTIKEFLKENDMDITLVLFSQRTLNLAMEVEDRI